MIPGMILTGLCFLLVFIPFNEGGGNSTALFVTQTLVLFLIVLRRWAIHDKQWEGHILPATYYLLPTVFILWSFSSLFTSEYLYLSLQEIIKLLTYFGVFILCREIGAHKRSQSILLLALLFSIYVQAILALFYRYGTPSGKFQSGFINMHDFATFLEVGLMLVGVRSLDTVRTLFFASDPGPRFRVSLVDIGFLISTFFLSGALLFTNSRSSLLSLVIALLVLLYFRMRKVFYVIVAALILFILIPNPLRAQIFQWKQEDPFAYDRIQIWKSSLSMIRDHPLLGVGLGMFGGYFEQYRFPTENWIARYSKTTTIAHNEFLQAGAELGIPGLVLAIVLVYWTLSSGIRKLVRSPDSIKSGLLVSLIVVLTQSLVNSVFHSPAIAITTVVLTALLMNQDRTWQSSVLNPQSSTLISLFAFYFWIIAVLYPFLGHFYYHKTQTLLNQDKPLEAIEALNKALGYIPIHSYYHNLLGSLYVTAFKNQPNWEAFYGGIKEFSEAIRWNSRESQFYQNRADLYLELVRRLLPTEPTLQRGIADYQTAITLDPFDPFLRYNLANAYVSIKRYSDAKEQLEKAIELEPNFIGGHHLLSKVLVALGEKGASDEKQQIARNLAERFHPESYHSGYLKSLFQRPDSL